MVDQVHLKAGWYQEWMPKLKGEFEACNIEVPRHQSMLDDLQHIKIVNGVPQIDKGRTKDTESGGKAKRHGDFAVALAMANRASWMNGCPADGYIGVPKRGSEDNKEAGERFAGAW